MGEVPQDELIRQLQNQLIIARNEIKNLRQQVGSLKHTHKNDVEEIQSVLRNAASENPRTEIVQKSCSCEFPQFQSIGVIESWFSEKRGIPRQAGICKYSKGVVVLSQRVINNPSYALNGLEEFSHLWIIYHFHQTDASHVRSKVAPPRLNGMRVGVLSTRSPHRPCPIGLTLVKIDNIVDNKIYFSGVDMLDGTPVLDIKPYIPQYDNPTLVEQQPEREVDGRLSDEEAGSSSKAPEVVLPLQGPLPSREEALAEGREAPDGEEASVRVPAWISNPPATRLKVEFSEKGLAQLKEVPNHEPLQKTISIVLQEDPRSVYLRKKLGNQFYTFLIQELHVSCKFNDVDGVVTVYQVQKARQTCECGVPLWQCDLHSQ